MKDLLKLMAVLMAAAALFVAFNPITALVWLMVSTVETFGLFTTMAIIAAAVLGLSEDDDVWVVAE